jgi:hypothetical protein
LSILPDAATVIALLSAWFENYNEVHPHTLDTATALGLQLS